MKTCIKKSFVLPVLFAVVGVLMACPSQAQFIYTTNNGTIAITGFTGTNHDVVIPSTIHGLPVTSIGANAFQNAPINAVTIPNSVTNIGDSAFQSCASLTSIAIPNSVTNIGASAFRSCTSLTNVTIPNSVTSIGDFAFHSCTNLTSVTIPNSVTSIGTDAFDECTSLTGITIPNSVTRLGWVRSVGPA
jgi:hypothetical protein